MLAEAFMQDDASVKPLRRLRDGVRYLWSGWRQIRNAGGMERAYLAIAYRGWQLGHRFYLQARPARDYIRCRCGWEGRAASDGSMSTAAYVHLYDVIRAVDGVTVPRIDEWPPGISSTSTTTELYEALDLLERE